VSLVLIDWQAGLPGWWVLGEGPLRALLGGATLVLLRTVPPIVPRAGAAGREEGESP
jgi:hypothetical protein